MAAALESSIARLQYSLVTHIDRRVLLIARQGGKGDGLRAADEVGTFLRGRHGRENVMVIVAEKVFMPSVKSQSQGSVNWDCECVELWPCDEPGPHGQPTLPPPLKALVKTINSMSDWLRKDEKHVVALWEPTMTCAAAVMVKVSRRHQFGNAGRQS
jgi:hypothetical protein